MSMVSLPAGEVSDLRAAVKERDELRKTLVDHKARIIEKLRRYADGLHFAGDLVGERALRAFGKSLEESR